MEEGGDSEEEHKQCEPGGVGEATEERKEPSKISSGKFNKERNPERETLEINSNVPHLLCIMKNGGEINCPGS